MTLSANAAQPTKERSGPLPLEASDRLERTDPHLLKHIVPTISVLLPQANAEERRQSVAIRFDEFFSRRGIPVLGTSNQMAHAVGARGATSGRVPRELASGVMRIFRVASVQRAIALAFEICRGFLSNSQGRATKTRPRRRCCDVRDDTRVAGDSPQRTAQPVDQVTVSRALAPSIQPNL